MKNLLILKVLDKLDRESKAPTMDELGLYAEKYCEILEILLHGNLIKDVNIKREGPENKVISFDTNKTKITIYGIDYLEKNRELLSGQ